MSYQIHQHELWIKIGQIVNSDKTKQWTPETISESLGIPVDSDGYRRILEILEQKELEQSEEVGNIKIGFV
jgi:hypothetical protein